MLGPPRARLKTARQTLDSVEPGLCYTPKGRSAAGARIAAVQAGCGGVAVYLLAGAVNFDATISDSNDLSVIRGSSLSVLRFGDRLLDYLTQTLDESIAPEPLSTGASELLVRFSPKRSPSLRRGAVTAPFGGERTWKEKTLPALAAQAGSSADVARAWVGEHRQRIRSDRLEATERSIARQINEERAVRSAREAAAAAPNVDCAIIEATVRAFLDAPEQSDLRYFRFAYACCAPPSASGLADILAMLYSRQRTRQLQDLTVALADPVVPIQAAQRAFCSYTLGRLPAAPDSREQQPISASARARRSEGREQKQRFYERQLRKSAAAAEALADTSGHAELTKAAEWLEGRDFVFANDFGAIVADPEPARPLPPNARNKLAVIFFDGNGFSDKRRRRSELPAFDQAFGEYRRFCLALERNGGLILAALLPWLAERPAFNGVKDGQRYLRFETLLFGGDDICFVAPAWGAFALMGRLQEVFSNLRAPSRNSDESLTFKAGMVLASHKAPIRTLRNLASNLAYAAKATSGARNIVQVAALEGVDPVEAEIKQSRMELFGDSCPAAAFGLEGKDWEKIRETIDAINAKVGRSQLHRWFAKARHEGVLTPPTDDDREHRSKVQSFLKRFDEQLMKLEVPPDLRDVLTARTTLLASSAADWPLLPLHHVLTLADYVLPAPVAEEAAAA